MGYSVDFSDMDNYQYINPAGEVVATSTEVWEAVGFRKFYQIM